MPFLSGSVTAGACSFNGAPEGDPLSVAAMVAVCWHSHQHVRDYEVQHDSFVDNLSWSGHDPGQLQQALCASLDFLRCLRLPVDWGKSYCWGALPGPFASGGSRAQPTFSLNRAAWRVTETRAGLSTTMPRGCDPLVCLKASPAFISSVTSLVVCWKRRNSYVAV